MSTSILNRLASPATTPPFTADDLQWTPDDQDQPQYPQSTESPSIQPSVDTWAPPPPTSLPEQQLLGLEAQQTQEQANQGGPSAASAPQSAPPPSTSVAGPVPQGPLPLTSPEAYPDTDPYAAAMAPQPAPTMAPPAAAETPLPLPPPGGAVSNPAPASVPAAPTTSPTAILARRTPTATDAAQDDQDTLQHLKTLLGQSADLAARHASQSPPGVGRQILATVAGMFLPGLAQIIANPGNQQYKRQASALQEQIQDDLTKLKASESMQNIQSQIDTRTQTAADRATAQQNTVRTAQQVDAERRAKDGQQVIPLPADGTPPASVIPPGYYAIPPTPYDPPNSVRVRPTVAEAQRQKTQAQQEGFVPLPSPIAKGLQMDPNMKVDPKNLPAYVNAYTEFQKQQQTQPETVIAERKKIASDIGLTGERLQEYLANGKIERPPVTNLSVMNASDPNSVQNALQGVMDNPDSYFELDKNMQAQVRTKMRSQYGLPPPVKLNPDVAKQESSSQIALEHAANLKTLLSDPVVQSRLGPIMGRIGNAEQDIGASAGLSPQDAQKVQAVRTALNYFFMREGRALFGGRPPEKLMEELQKTSPNTKMAVPLMNGAIDQAVQSAKNTILSAEKQRFGGKTRPGFSAGYTTGTGGGNAGGQRSYVRTANNGAMGQTSDGKWYDTKTGALIQ